jgi:hypothetical protein
MPEPTAHPNGSAGSCLAAALGHYPVGSARALATTPIGKPGMTSSASKGPANT